MRSTRKIVTQEEWDALMRSSVRLDTPVRRPGRLRHVIARLLHNLADRIASPRS